MRIQGYTVTAAQESAGRNVFNAPAFGFHDVVIALVNAGVPPEDYVADRVADALLQTARRNGEIKYVGGKGKQWQSVKN